MKISGSVVGLEDFGCLLCGTVHRGKITINDLSILWYQIQKAQMIEKVTDAMVEVESKGMRGTTWVRVIEIRSVQWGVGGNTPSVKGINAMAADNSG